ncbi:MAG: glutathione S-transferase family protein [Spirulinaceae cyanobacterium RM2_2_10]|nr:glutathione S-transferase family protein [Spirulinaceae cyanobacterium SM2_1_0]NJO19721.1 glutathione S-transferase family protein [Spirulinaceae cyanobacterium RM2_2_10]
MTALTLIIGNKNYSSWSLRPWLAMRQVGLEFTENRVPLDLPTTRAAILEHSPTGRVPALRDGAVQIWESLAICEYIAETYAPSLWPTEPRPRAIARAVSAEMHAGFADLRANMPLDCRSRYPRQGRTPATLQDIERVLALWQQCRQEFGQDGPFLFGQFSIADAMYAPVVSRFVTYEVELPAIARTYTETLWQLPAMQDWLHAAEQETEVLSLH